MRYGFVQANTDRAFHVDEISYRVIAFLGVVRFPLGIAFQGRFYRVLSVINARVQPTGAILRPPGLPGIEGRAAFGLLHGRLPIP